MSFLSKIKILLNRQPVSGCTDSALFLLALQKREIHFILSMSEFQKCRSLFSVLMFHRLDSVAIYCRFQRWAGQSSVSTSIHLCSTKISGLVNQNINLVVPWLQHSGQCIIKGTDSSDNFPSAHHSFQGCRFAGPN